MASTTAVAAPHRVATARLAAAALAPAPHLLRRALGLLAASHAYEALSTIVITARSSVTPATTTRTRDIVVHAAGRWERWIHLVRTGNLVEDEVFTTSAHCILVRSIRPGWQCAADGTFVDPANRSYLGGQRWMDLGRGVRAVQAVHGYRTSLRTVGSAAASTIVTEWVSPATGRLVEEDTVYPRSTGNPPVRFTQSTVRLFSNWNSPRLRRQLPHVPSAELPNQLG